MPTRRPLVVTNDLELLDEILGLAAIAGVEVTTAADLAAARPHWVTAPLVLVDIVLARRLPAATLSRRAGLAFVCCGAPPADLAGHPWAGNGENLISLPAASQALLDRLARYVAPPADYSRVVGVVAGSGGAGASVLAAALALSAVPLSPPSWLVDLDPTGGGADLAFGLEKSPGLRWSDLYRTAGRLSPMALRDALPVKAGVAVLSCARGQAGPPEPRAVEAVLTAVQGGGGTCVVDLPRQASAARATALALVDEVLLVVPSEVKATAAARWLLDDLTVSSTDIRVVVRSTPPLLLAPTQVAAALAVPLAGSYLSEPSVRAATREGRPPRLRRGSLARLCKHLVYEGDRSGAVGAGR